MADREYSWQKANPAGDPAEIARVHINYLLFLLAVET